MAVTKDDLVISVKVGGETTKSQKALDGVNSSLNEFESNLEKTTVAGEKNRAVIDELGTSFKRDSKHIDSVAMSLEKLKETIDQVNESFTHQRDAINSNNELIVEQSKAFDKLRLSLSRVTSTIEDMRQLKSTLDELCTQKNIDSIRSMGIGLAFIAGMKGWPDLSIAIAEATEKIIKLMEAYNSLVVSVTDFKDNINNAYKLNEALEDVLITVGAIALRWGYVFSKTFLDRNASIVINILKTELRQVLFEIALFERGMLNSLDRSASELHRYISNSIPDSTKEYLRSVEKNLRSINLSAVFNDVAKSVKGGAKNLANQIDTEIFYLIHGSDSSFRKLANSFKLYSAYASHMFNALFEPGKIGTNAKIISDVIRSRINNVILNAMGDFDQGIGKLVKFVYTYRRQLNVASTLLGLAISGPIGQMATLLLSYYDGSMRDIVLLLAATMQKVSSFVLGPFTNTIVRATHKSIDALEVALSKNQIRWIPEFDPIWRPALLSRFKMIFGLIQSNLASFAKDLGTKINDLFTSGDISKQSVAAVNNLFSVIGKSITFGKRQLGNVLNFGLDSAYFGFWKIHDFLVEGFASLSTVIPALFKTSLTKLGAAFEGFKALSAGIPGLFKYSLNELSAVFVNSITSLVNISKSGFSLLSGVWSVAASELKFAKNVANKDFAETFVKQFSRIYAGANNVGKAFKDLGRAIPHSSLVLFAEYGAMTSSILGTLGTSLLHAEGAFKKFLGVAIIAAGIALGGFASLLGVFITKVSDAAYAIGDYLYDAMDKFAQGAQKAEAIAAQFIFTIKGFNRTMGVESVGSIEAWSDIIDKSVKSSSFSFMELQKSVKILVAEGTAMGTSFQENQNILARAMDLAAQSGTELSDMAVKIAKAVSGTWTQSLMDVGVNLSDAAVAHSEYAMRLGKTTEQMSQQELVQARLSEFYKQTTPILGAAGLQLDTVAGMTEKVNQSMEKFQHMIGRSGFFTIMFKTTILNLSQALLSIPQPLIDIFSALTDFMAVLLKVTGFVFGTSLAFISLIGTYHLLEIAVARFTFIQEALNLSFKFLNTSIDANLVRVTALSDVWKNILALKAGGLVQILAVVKTYAVQAAAAIGKFTLAILANPLFWKVAAIVAAVMVITEAIKELRDEIAWLSEEFDSGGKNPILETFDKIKDSIKATISVAIQFTKILILGLVSVGVLARKAYLELKNFMNGGRDPSILHDIETTNKMIVDLGKNMEGNAVRMLTAFEAATGAAKAHAAEMKHAAISAEMLKVRHNALAEAAKEVNQEAIKIGVLGDEYDKIALAINQSKAEVKKFGDEFAKSAEKGKENLDGYVKGLNDLYKAEADLQKLRLDTVEKFNQESGQLVIERLKSQGKETEAIRLEFAKRRGELEKYQTLLGKIGGVSAEDLAKVTTAFKELAHAEQAAIKASIDEKAKTALEEENRIIKEKGDLLKSIAEKNLELQKSINVESGKSLQEQITEELSRQITVIDEQIARSKILYGANNEIVDSLQKQKDLLEKNAAIEIKKAPSPKFQQLEKVGKDAADSISGVFSKGALSMVGGAASMVGLVVTAVNAILDIIPNMISSVAGIFDKLTDFPNILFKAFGGLFNSIIVFVQKFIPQMIESVGKSLLQTDQFIEGLIDAFKGLFAQIPGMIKDVFKTLPDIIYGLMDTLTSAYPEMLMMAAEFIITSLPQMVIDLVKNIVTKVIPAIINGAINGTVKLFKKFTDFLNGKKLNVPKIDTGKAQEHMKKLSENASRLFKVEDVLEAAKNPLQKVREDIAAAFEKGRDYLKEAWMWVWDNVISPIWDVVTKAWRWVWDTVLEPIWDVVTKAWRWVWDTVLEPIFNLITKAWQWVWDKVLGPIHGMVQNAFKYVQDIFGSLGGIVSGAFSFVKGLWDGFANVVSGAFQFVKALWDNLVNIVKAAFESPRALWEALKDSVRIAFSYVENLWNNLVGTVQNAFSFVKTIFDTFNAAFQTVFTFVYENIIKPLQSVGQALAKPLQDVFGKMSQFGQDIAAPIKDAFKGISDFFSHIGKAFESLFKFDLKGFGSSIGNALKSALDTVFSGFKKGINAIINLINNLKFDPIDVGFNVLGKHVGFTIPGIDLVPGHIATLNKGGQVMATAATLHGFGQDTVPAALTPGEFVVSRKGVQSAGIALLSHINKGGELGNGGSQVNNFNFEIRIDAKTTVDEGFIRGTLVPKMKEELKRASLDGQFVISQRGVR